MQSSGEKISVLMNSSVPLITRRRRRSSSTILNTIIRLIRYVFSWLCLVSFARLSLLSHFLVHYLTYLTHRMAVQFTLNKWVTSTSTPCTKSPAPSVCFKTSLSSTRKWPIPVSQLVPAKLVLSSKPAAPLWISRALESPRFLLFTHT